MLGGITSPVKVGCYSVFPSEIWMIDEVWKFYFYIMKDMPSTFLDETVIDAFSSGNKKVFNFSVYAFRDGKISKKTVQDGDIRWILGYSLKNEIIKCYNKTLLLYLMYEDIISRGYHQPHLWETETGKDWCLKTFWGACVWGKGQVGPFPGEAVNCPTPSSP